MKRLCLLLTPSHVRNPQKIQYVSEFWKFLVVQERTYLHIPQYQTCVFVEGSAMWQKLKCCKGSWSSASVFRKHYNLLLKSVSVLVGHVNSILATFHDYF